MTRSQLLSFQRLLKSCEEIAEGEHKGRDDLKNWKISPAFHHVGQFVKRFELCVCVGGVVHGLKCAAMAMR